MGLFFYVLVDDVLRASNLFRLDDFYCADDEKKGKLTVVNSHIRDKFYASTRQLSPIA